MKKFNQHHSAPEVLANQQARKALRDAPKTYITPKQPLGSARNPTRAHRAN